MGGCEGRQGEQHYWPHDGDEWEAAPTPRRGSPRQVAAEAAAVAQWRRAQHTSPRTAPPTAEEACQDGRAVWQVTGKSLLLRSGPGLDSPALCRLPAGVQLVVDAGVTLDDADQTVRFHVAALRDEQGQPLPRGRTFDPPLADPDVDE